MARTMKKATTKKPAAPKVAAKGGRKAAAGKGRGRAAAKASSSSK